VRLTSTHTPFFLASVYARFLHAVSSTMNENNRFEGECLSSHNGRNFQLKTVPLAMLDSKALDHSRSSRTRSLSKKRLARV